MDQYPTWVSDVHDLNSALEMIERIGMLVGRKNESDELIKKIKNNFRNLQPLKNELTAIYLIWKGPYMTVGGDTFIHDMLEACGLKNAYSDSVRYPKISEDEIRSLNPDVVFLSSEPYPFGDKDLNELKLALPNSNIILVNGEYFSWYGSKLMESPDYFRELIMQIKTR